MKFFSENHSGHVNIDSGTGSFFHPFQTGIHIHIPSESVFTSLRNDYSHAPESAQLPQITRYIGLPDTGSEEIARTYPLGKDFACLAQNVIFHLGRALTLLNINASSAQMEVAIAIGVWRDARVQS
jgi:hypothetical protein